MTKLFIVTGGTNPQNVMFAHVMAGSLELGGVETQVISLMDLAKVTLVEATRTLFGETIEFPNILKPEAVQVFMQQQKNSDQVDWVEILKQSIAMYIGIYKEVIIIPDIYDVNDLLDMQTMVSGTANLITKIEDPVSLRVARTLDLSFHVDNAQDIIESALEYADIVLENEDTPVEAEELEECEDGSLKGYM